MASSQESQQVLNELTLEEKITELQKAFIQDLPPMKSYPIKKLIDYANILKNIKIPVKIPVKIPKKSDDKSKYTDYINELYNCIQELRR